MENFEAENDILGIGKVFAKFDSCTQRLWKSIAFLSGLLCEQTNSNF